MKRVSVRLYREESNLSRASPEDTGLPAPLFERRCKQQASAATGCRPIRGIVLTGPWVIRGSLPYKRALSFWEGGGERLVVFTAPISGIIASPASLNIGCWSRNASSPSATT